MPGQALFSLKVFAQSVENRIVVRKRVQDVHAWCSSSSASGGCTTFMLGLVLVHAAVVQYPGTVENI